MSMLKKKQILIGLLVTVVALGLIAMCMKGTLQTVFMILVFVALVAYLVLWMMLWRCPSCHEHLGRLDSSTHCKYCGSELFK